MMKMNKFSFVVANQQASSIKHQVATTTKHIIIASENVTS